MDSERDWGIVVANTLVIATVCIFFGLGAFLIFLLSDYSDPWEASQAADAWMMTAAEAVEEYEDANAVALGYELAGDAWKAALAHGVAAEAARNAAGLWAESLEVFDMKNFNHGEAVEYRQMAAVEVHRLTLIEAVSLERASKLALEAGRDQAADEWELKAADAMVRSEISRIGTVVTDDTKDMQDVLDAIERLGTADSAKRTNASRGR